MANFCDLAPDAILEILKLALDEQTICVIPRVCHQWREMSKTIVTREIIEKAAWDKNIPALKMGLAHLNEWNVSQEEFDFLREYHERSRLYFEETDEFHMENFIRGLEERNMDFTNQYRPLSPQEEEQMALNSKSASLCEEWALKKWG